MKSFPLNWCTASSASCCRRLIRYYLKTNPSYNKPCCFRIQRIQILCKYKKAYRYRSALRSLPVMTRTSTILPKPSNSLDTSSLRASVESPTFPYQCFVTLSFMGTDDGLTAKVKTTRHCFGYCGGAEVCGENGCGGREGSLSEFLNNVAEFQ